MHRGGTLPVDGASVSTQSSESSIARVYAWFLELPPPIVLATLWLAGAATLIIVCGLVPYLLWLSLQAVAGG